MAEVELVVDSNTYAPEDVQSLRDQVIGLFRELVDQRGFAEVESLSRLFDGNLPLSQIVDLIAYACGAEPLQQQRVLAEPEVCRRAEVLIEILHRLLKRPSKDPRPAEKFPPGFSEN
jgi:hypothetical protein